MEIEAKNYLKISLIFVAFLFILFGITIFLMLFLSPRYYYEILEGLLILFAVLSTIIIIGTSEIIIGYKKQYMPLAFHSFIKKFIVYVYPFMSLICGALKLDKHDLKLFLITINNILVSSKNFKVNSSDIMLLTPHCLQNSECKIKITNDANNCKRCGSCNINDLLSLSEKYGIKFFVASGGTFARKVISDANPKFIISIACERDLWSGIMDVNNVPVFGIVNNRPNGPCVNTNVDCKQIESAIQKFIQLR